jgi:hypothetical protein
MAFTTADRRVKLSVDLYSKVSDNGIMMNKGMVGDEHKQSDWTDCSPMGSKNAVAFVHPDVSDSDRELFGFNDGDELWFSSRAWSLAHVMHAAGIFSSVSQARKNGWNNEIGSGFSQFIVGKRKLTVSILNRIDREDDSD